MKKFLLLGLALPSLAFAIPPLPQPVGDAAAALREQALHHDDHAWDIVEGLTTEVGPRLRLGAGEPRAWAMRKLTSLGFSNVRVEEFDMPVWVRGEEKGEILAPFPQPLALTALGNSGATPARGPQRRLRPSSLRAGLKPERSGPRPPRSWSEIADRRPAAGLSG